MSSDGGIHKRFNNIPFFNSIDGVLVRGGVQKHGYTLKIMWVQNRKRTKTFYKNILKNTYNTKQYPTL